ncbi:MAG: glycosyltransferase [Planctomycetes bacterium]|nr:glycosyltransferase [Planctomycetota bacterium]
MTTFGLCVIARDEETNLPRLLASVRGIVDETVVVDTGSRDRTLELAAELGARTATFAWCDDFAAARNAASELVRADWVIALDADEELVTESARERLEAFVRSGADVGRVEIENVGTPSGPSRVEISRVFRRAAGIRFAGRVHEQLVRDGAPLVRASTGLVVRHHGYAPAALAARDKFARNRSLLELALAEAPDDGYAWFQLGRVEHAAGRHAAALEALERALARADDADPWAPEALECAGYSLRALGRSAQALGLLRQLDERYFSRPDTCFLRGLLALDVGDLTLAETGFRRALELGGEAPSRGERVTAAATTAPAYNLGVMREVLGDAEGARAWYARVLAYEPEHVEARAGLARLG